MIFIDNKYTKCYFSIIDKAKSTDYTGIYSELHHVVPKSLGGDNSINNLVRLSAREHYVCHRLLTKMTTGDNRRRMLYAVWAIVNQQTSNQERHKVNSRTYLILREEHKTMHSERMRGSVGANKGKKFSEDTKQKMSVAAKARGVSPQARSALIAARKGIPSHNKGKPMSEEQKEKIRIAALRRWGSLKD